MGSPTYLSPNLLRSNQLHHALVAGQKDNILLQLHTRLPNLLCLRLKSRYSISNATRVVPGLPPRLCNLAYTCIDVGYVPSCKYLATLAAATWLNTVLSLVCCSSAHMLFSIPQLRERGAGRHIAPPFRNSTGPRRGYAREWFAAVKTVQS